MRCALSTTIVPKAVLAKVSNMLLAAKASTCSASRVNGVGESVIVARGNGWQCSVPGCCGLIRAAGLPAGGYDARRPGLLSVDDIEILVRAFT
jgi:hypothetical protein